LVKLLLLTFRLSIPESLELITELVLPMRSRLRTAARVRLQACSNAKNVSWGNYDITRLDFGPKLNY